MNNLKKKLTFVLGLAAASGAIGGVLLACSDDSSVGPGGTDGGGGTDGATEGSTTPDGGTDSAVDAGPDVIVVEAGTVAAFIEQNAKATCARYKECCGAAAFDEARCNTDFALDGWVQSLDQLTVDGVADGGKVTYDPAIASQCLTAIRNMTCKNTTAAEYKNAWQKCFSAATGTGAVGTACKTHVECVNTSFCDPDNDGGTCTTLLGAGVACQRNFNAAAPGQCSYRSTGASQCRGAAGTETCQGLAADGTDCEYDWDCQSGACSPTDDAGTAFKCSSTVDFLFGICDYYKVDGGP